MQISVKQLDGTKKDYNVEPDQSIANLKEEVAEVTGVPIDACRLIYNGKMLDDDQKIEDCTVKAGDTINMVLNL